MRNLSLLGSTGSIGKQTLTVVRGLNRNGDFPVSVKTLAANENIEALEEQIREFKPEAAVVYNEEKAKQLKKNVKDLDVRVLAGMDGLCEAAAWETADITLNAVVGMIGLKPTLAAINAKKTLALANKETLVAGGHIVMNAAKQNNVAIMPVDSEHSAIFQCLQGCPEKNTLRKLVLTASGGPFFGKTREELKNVKVEDALKHPNWSMGAKITIDSATMMNKGLEVIEASWLFDMPAEDIDVVIHRESIIHSLIEYQDYSMIAQLGLPDMYIPIQYALTYPYHTESPAKPMRLSDVKNLSFYEPDYQTFQCLSVCIEAIKTGGIAPAVANSANEEAVDLFLKKKINFCDIGALVSEAVENAPKTEVKDIEDIFSADRFARKFVLDTM